MSSWGEIHPAPSVLRQYNAPDRPARSAAQQVLQGLTTVCACSYLNNVTHLDLAFTQVANLAALAQVRSSCSAARQTPALLRQLIFARVPSGLDESQWSCVCYSTHANMHFLGVDKMHRPVMWCALHPFWAYALPHASPFAPGAAPRLRPSARLTLMARRHCAVRAMPALAHAGAPVRESVALRAVDHG